jgi:hypothetical protein
VILKMLSFGGAMNGPQQMASIITRLCAGCVFSALTLAWSHARADEATNALLDLLKAKGAITQSEYDNQSAPTGRSER